METSGPGQAVPVGSTHAPHQPHTESVNVTVVEVTRRADGKLYPAQPLTREQRIRARRLAHNLVHRDGLSVRAAQRTMVEQYGLRRSLGIIARDLKLWECPSCADDPAAEPDKGPGEVSTTQQPITLAGAQDPGRALAAAVHQSPGGLTGMLRDE